MWCVSLPLEKSLDFISVWSILIGEHMRDHLRAFYSQLKSKVGNILAKATALRIDLKIDGAPIASRSHTHPHTLKPLAFSPRPSPSVSPSPLHRFICHNKPSVQLRVECGLVTRHTQDLNDEGDPPMA